MSSHRGKTHQLGTISAMQPFKITIQLYRARFLSPKYGHMRHFRLLSYWTFATGISINYVFPTAKMASLLYAIEYHISSTHYSDVFCWFHYTATVRIHSRVLWLNYADYDLRVAPVLSPDVMSDHHWPVLLLLIIVDQTIRVQQTVKDQCSPKDRLYRAPVNSYQ